MSLFFDLIMSLKLISVHFIIAVICAIVSITASILSLMSMTWAVVENSRRLIVIAVHRAGGILRWPSYDSDGRNSIISMFSAMVFFSTLFMLSKLLF